jgi:hypothetical protein
MSIVVLKRKTAARYGPHTPPESGSFSLNGIYRFVGVGPTNLAKSVTRTPFVGLIPKGHGGGSRCRVGGIKGRATKCSSSTGGVSNVVSKSGSNLTTQTTVKVSSLSNAAMLDTKFMGIFHGAYPNSWVQPPKLDMSQQAEQKQLKEIYNQVCSACPTVNGRPCVSNGSGCVAPYTKDLNTHVQTYAQYNQRLLSRRFNAVPHFPFHMTNSGCNTFYRRVEDVPSTA